MPLWFLMVNIVCAFNADMPSIAIQQGIGYKLVAVGHVGNPGFVVTFFNGNFEVVKGNAAGKFNDVGVESV